LPPRWSTTSRGSSAALAARALIVSLIVPVGSDSFAVKVPRELLRDLGHRRPGYGSTTHNPAQREHWCSAATSTSPIQADDNESALPGR
jgi:hypothetical protein